MAGSGPVKMQRVEDWADPYIPSKFGDKNSNKPYQVCLLMSNNFGEIGTDDRNIIEYNYSIKKDYVQSESWEWERQPARKINVMQPQYYKGNQSESLQLLNDCFIVNGILEKFDTNFLSEFHVEKIGDTQIYVGSYPKSEGDIIWLKQKGITGILNLMSKPDLDRLNLDKIELIKHHRIHGIHFSKHHAIDDKDLVSKNALDNLVTASQYLDDMINEKDLQVFIHSSSGHTRAATIVIIYLCLFKMHKDWKSPHKVAQFVRSQYKQSNPNMEAVLNAIN